MKKIFLGSCAVGLVVVGLFYACKKNPNGGEEVAKRFMTNTSTSEMRVFEDFEALNKEIENIFSMDEEELEAYEKEIHFMSFGRKAESIYYELIRPYEENDEGLSEEQANEYVSKYPQYLEVKTISSQDDEVSFEFIPKYDGHLFYHIMNADRMFQMGDNVYKVFKDYVIGVPIEKKEILFSITEENINGEVNNNPDLEILCGCEKRNTQKTTIHDKDLVELEQTSSNNREKVKATYEVKKINLAGASFVTYTQRYIKGQWRGNCWKCCFINSKRTLNVNIYVVVDINGNKRYATDQYKSKKAEYSDSKLLIEQEGWNWTDCYSFKGVIHSLDGTVSIATATITQ